MVKLIFLCLGFLSQSHVYAATKLHVKKDGQPVTGRGIFLPGCVYGDDASLSDHAPMLWPKEKIGTWNITSRVSHKQIVTKKDKFMGHKFKTNQKGELVDRFGKPALRGHASEADILTKTTITNHYYGRRLQNIAKRIKSLFSQHQLDYLAVQEIPYKGQRDVDGNNLQQLFSAALAPELTITYPTENLSKKDSVDKIIDAALISRAKQLLSPVIDQENRIQAFCDRKENRCITSVHLLSANEDDAKKRCAAIQKVVETLKKRGFSKISVLGDFNMSADRMARFCNNVVGFSPTIHTSQQKAQSCATNNGDASPNNIDLFLEY